MNSKYYLSLLLAFNRELNPEWKKYQTEYKEFLVKNATDDSTRERAEKIDIGMKQVYIKSLKRLPPWS